MKALKKEDIRLISSGQVITGVIDCIKELLENSLDAGAKNITIKLVESGLSSITIIDDGCGIPLEGRETVAHAFTTSKITSIPDLTNDLSTFGFRGEALHAISCQGKLVIITRTNAESIGQKLYFSNDGNILKTESVSANIGTTVIVTDLMSCFPVRRLSESSRITKESLNTFFVRYFLAYPQVRFTIEANPIYSVTRPPMSSLMAAFNKEFGQKISSSLSLHTYESYSGDIRIKLTALLPSPKSEWRDSSTSQKTNSSPISCTQVLLVNGRPVKNNDIFERINKFYQTKYGLVPRRYPRFVVCLDFFRDTSLCSSLFEVNLDAAKSSALFVDYTIIYQLLDKAMNFDSKPSKVITNFIDSYPKGIEFHPFHPKSSEIPVIPHSNDDIDNEKLKQLEQKKLEGLSCYKWNNIGKFGKYTIFHIDNGMGSDLIIFGNTEGLFEKIGVSRAEISRLNEAELILLYYDQVLETNQENQCLFFSGDFTFVP